MGEMPIEAPLSEEVEMQPFTEGGLKIWLRELLQWEPEEGFLEWLHRETKGLPGRLRRGLRYLLEQGILEKQVEGWQVDRSCKVLHYRKPDLKLLPTDMIHRARKGLTIQLIASAKAHSREHSLSAGIKNKSDNRNQGVMIKKPDNPWNKNRRGSAALSSNL